MIDKTKEEKLEECVTALEKNQVGWKVFAWVISIFVVIIGWQLTTINNLSVKVGDTQIESSKIQAQLSQIQTDLSWIKLTLGNKK